MMFDTQSGTGANSNSSRILTQIGIYILIMKIIFMAFIIVELTDPKERKILFHEPPISIS